MRIALLFVLLAIVVCAALSPGNFGSFDPKARLQVARWLRGAGPESDPAGKTLSIPDRRGKRHAVSGIGQSLVFLPFDAVVEGAGSPFLRRTGLSLEKQQQLAEALIAFLAQAAVTAAILILGYHLLLSFGFSPLVSAAGVLALLFGSTCLQYAQCAQENDLLLALDLGALCSIQRWRRGGPGWAVLAGAACGFALLTRLTTGMDTLVFGLLGASARNWRQFLRGYLPPILAALGVDRLYHWVRFAEFFSTYTGVWTRQFDLTKMPPGFPYSYPFWKGFVGTLVSPDKSILLFDPLLLVLALVAVWRWRRLERDLRATLICILLLLGFYISFYARYWAFGGDVAWGHRYVLPPVQLLALFAIPLLLVHGGTLPVLARRSAWALLAASVVLQCASTAISPNLEVIQRRNGFGSGVVWNRVGNLAALADSSDEVARFRGVPIEWRSLYYLPFQLRLRFPQLAVWAIRGWLILVLCLPVLMIATLRIAAQAQSPG